jgi:trimeric autotransporter adhesin
MTNFSPAQIIQGEAASQAGQFAVASTIFNRMQAGNFGGSTAAGVVNDPGQFVGNLKNAPIGAGVPDTVSPFAASLGADLSNGIAPQGGTTGNALYFLSGPSSIASGGGTNIGGNFFSDRFGPPSSDFQPPVYGGAPNPTSGGSGVPAGLPSNGTGNFYDLTGSDQFGQGPPGQDGSVPSGANNSSVGMGALTGNGDLTQFSVAGVNAPASTPDSVAPNGNDQGTPNLGGGLSGPVLSTTGAPANTPASDTTATPGDAKPTDVPTAIATGFNTLTAGLGKAISGAASTGSSAITNSTTAATTAGTTWLGSIFPNVTAWLERAGLGLLAIVLIALAVIFIALNSRKSGSEPINLTLAAVP